MKALRTAVLALLLPLYLTLPALAEGAQEERPYLPPTSSGSVFLIFLVLMFLVMSAAVVWYFHQRRK